MNVAILIGSVRKNRQSHSAAYYVAYTLEKRGYDTELVDLAKTPLPILGRPGESDPQWETNINKIGKKLDAADALIVLTPEYHGSLSGVLKNAIDHYWKEFQKKPVGVVAASAGKMAGINASTQLQHVILSLGAYPLPLKLLIPDIQNAFDDEFEPQNEKIAANTDKFLDEFLWFVDAIVDKKMKESKEERAA